MHKIRTPLTAKKQDDLPYDYIHDMRVKMAVRMHEFGVRFCSKGNITTMDPLTGHWVYVNQNHLKLIIKGWLKEENFPLKNNQLTAFCDEFIGDCITIAREKAHQAGAPVNIKRRKLGE
jgi:hypothetical protein